MALRDRRLCVISGRNSSQRGNSPYPLGQKKSRTGRAEFKREGSLVPNVLCLAPHTRYEVDHSLGEYSEAARVSKKNTRARRAKIVEEDNRINKGTFSADWFHPSVKKPDS